MSIEFNGCKIETSTKSGQNFWRFMVRHDGILIAVSKLVYPSDGVALARGAGWAECYVVPK